MAHRGHGDSSSKSHFIDGDRAIAVFLVPSLSAFDRLPLGGLVLCLVLPLIPAGGEAEERSVTGHLADSAYVVMHDGVKLAAEIWLPGRDLDASPATTIASFTRYWRAAKGQVALAEAARHTARILNEAGYAYVIVDVRGSGASFGSRSTEWSDAEIRDYGQVLRWLEQQPWSNGRIVTLGTSYLGNSAELATLSKRPSLRAVVSRFSDFDVYRHAVAPGGVLNQVLIEEWARFVAALDANEYCSLVPAPCPRPGQTEPGVKPVSGAEHLLDAAIRDHRDNFNIVRHAQYLEFADDRFARPDSKATLESISPAFRHREIDAAGVPSYHWASWLDGATAAGALSRYLTYRAPMRLIIGAWNHGATRDADPFSDAVADTVSPSIEAQFADMLRFVASVTYSGAEVTDDIQSGIRYFTLGANRWQDTSVWPPRGMLPARWYFNADGLLAETLPHERQEPDVYRVDYSATTGVHNRWHAQLGGPVAYPDRSEEDRKLLTYTSRPLACALEITGTPTARLWLESSQPDGALFVYVEDVGPTGRVTYLTEGVLRLSHAQSIGAARYRVEGPYRTHHRDDAKELVPGRIYEIELSLLPISVRLEEGHRLRVAIAGADRDTFAQPVSFESHQELKFHQSAYHASHIDLPSAAECGPAT